MKSLAECIPWIPELFRDLAVLLPQPGEISKREAQTGEQEYIWFLGERRVDAVRAFQAHPALASGQAPGIVLIGNKREELFAEKNTLNTVCMGFMRDMQRPNWSRGLPYPVMAISASFCVSRLVEHEAQTFFREACLSLHPGGILFLSDFFLPQNLSRLTRYQQEHARQLEAAGNGDMQNTERAAFDALFRERNLMLLETAIQSLTENGFGNIEIVAKRMNLAVIAAYR